MLMDSRCKCRSGKVRTYSAPLQASQMTFYSELFSVIIISLVASALKCIIADGQLQGMFEDTVQVACQKILLKKKCKKVDMIYTRDKTSKYTQHDLHFTDFDKSLDSAGHGELFAVCWTRLLCDGVLWQTPTFLHHQFLTEKNTNKWWAAVHCADVVNNADQGRTDWTMTFVRIYLVFLQATQWNKTWSSSLHLFTCRAPTGLHSDCWELPEVFISDWELCRRWDKQKKRK